MINLGISVNISFSESNSEKFRLFFLVCFCHIQCFYLFIYFLLVLRSTSQDRVQLLLQIYPAGHSFVLVETGIHRPEYSCQKGDFKTLQFAGIQYSKPSALKLNNG